MGGSDSEDYSPIIGGSEAHVCWFIRSHFPVLRFYYWSISTLTRGGFLLVYCLTDFLGLPLWTVLAYPSCHDNYSVYITPSHTCSLAVYSLSLGLTRSHARGCLLVPCSVGPKRVNVAGPGNMGDGTTRSTRAWMIGADVDTWREARRSGQVLGDYMDSAKW